jgi:hypothetical protein
MTHETSGDRRALMPRHRIERTTWAAVRRAGTAQATMVARGRAVRVQDYFPVGSGTTNADAAPLI